jgi:hypothetical protein
MLACVNDSAIAPELCLPSDIPPKREELFQAVETIVGRGAMMAFEIGVALNKLRSTYTDKQTSIFFGDVESRFGWEKSSTYAYMAVGQRFGDRPGALQAIGPRLPATALFKLCAPAVDSEVFDAVLAAAETHKITLRQVEKLISYGKLRSQLAITEGGINSEILESAYRELPTARPLPTVVELLSLYARKGDVRPFEDGLVIDREGGVTTFGDRAAAAKAWIEWQRKPDYIRFPLQVGDRVRFAAEDLPEAGGESIGTDQDWWQVMAVRNWRVQVELNQDQQANAYRAGIVEHIRPEPREVNYPTREEITEFPRPVVQESPTHEAQARKVAGDRPLWVSVCSIIWRVGPDGDRQLGTISELDADICQVDWPTGPQRYTWEEFAAANIHHCTEQYRSLKSVFDAVGQSLALDMLQMIFKESKIEENYCNA